MGKTLRGVSICGILPAFLLLSAPKAGAASRLAGNEPLGALRPGTHGPVIDKLRSSFIESSAKLTKDAFTFRGSKMVADLFQFKAVENKYALGYLVSFDLTYIPALDLGFIDVSLADPKSEREIASETVDIYPYVRKDGRRDVEIVMNDVRFSGYEYLSGLEMKDECVDVVSKLSAHSVVSQAVFTETVRGVSFSYGDGGEEYIPTSVNGRTHEDSSGIIHPLSAISKVLTSYDEAVGFAKEKFPEPDFYLDPVAAVARKIKLQQVESDFKNNMKLSIPRHKNDSDKDHIGSQLLRNKNKEGYDPSFEDPEGFAWSNWDYGFSNMCDSGCPVFATYNLLVDLGYKPCLPVLIAFFEFCNADLLYGLGGGCVFNEEIMDHVRGLLLGAILPILIGGSIALIVTIPVVGQILGATGLLGSAGAWLVADFILSNQRGLGDVMDCLSLSHSEKNILTHNGIKLFSEFKSEMKPTGNGIICFWNGVKEDLSIDYLDAAHFVYVSSEQDKKGNNHYKAYNVLGNSEVNECGDSDSGRMVRGNNKDWFISDEMAEKGMIAYYVIG